MKLLVIADDFTGSNDTGVQLAKKGARVDVSFSWQSEGSKKAEVVVINTESRALPAQQAQQRVAESIQAQKNLLNKNTIVYKKIDSTFRGNVGAEVASALQTSGATVAIIAAAIPAAGRVTRQGLCYVNGTPLLETEFASDPKTPIYSSSIKEIIASQTELPCGEIYLADVRSSGSNTALLTEKINQRIQSGDKIVVIDAENDVDLHLINQSLLQLQQPFMLVGAAGLANALSETFYLEPKGLLPTLVIAGSMSEATRKQINFAERENLVDVVDVDVKRLVNDQRQAEIDSVEQRAIETLNRGRHCVIRTCRDDKARDEIVTLCQEHQLTRQTLGDTISESLGTLSRSILQHSRVGGLFLTGGDIAIAVARALGAEGYRISAEVAPCIPCGTLINSEIDDLPVITKAGGFGTETTLKDSLYFLEELYGNE
jgi:uncharacterized protein YgbK (DUF1537 family)